MDYRDLGFDEWFERRLVPEVREAGFSAIDFDSLLEDGAINTSLLADKVLTSKKLRENIISNLNISALSRNYKAIVTPDGTGTHGDIQDAINYTSNQGGGDVLITSGTYKPKGNIELKSKVRVFGEGPGKTIIDFTNNNRRFVITGGAAELSLLSAYSDDAYQDITIANMSIRNSTNITGAVTMQYVRNALISNILFKGNVVDANLIVCLPGVIEACTSINSNNSTDSGLLQLNGGHSTIRGNVINNLIGGTAIALYGGGNATYLGCLDNLIDTAAENGIKLSAASNAVVRGNHLNAIDSVGIIISEGTSYRSIIEGNIINNSSSADGISTAGSVGTLAEYINIVNNLIDSVGTGIYVHRANNCRVIGNAVDNSTTGIETGATADRTLIDGNDVVGNTNKITDGGTNTTTGDNITA